MNLSSKILCIKTKNLGDAVVLTAAIRACPEDCVVDVLCFSDVAEYYALVPRVRRVYPAKRGLRGARAVYEGLRQLYLIRKERYDSVIHFSDDWRGALLALLSGAQVRVAGFSNKRSWLWHSCFTHLSRRPLRGRHVAEMDCDLLRRAGIYAGETPAYIRPTVGQESQNLGKKLLVINLFSRWKFKELDLEMGRGIVGHCIRSGYSILMVGEKSERARADLLCNKLEGDIDFLFGASFAKLASALDGALLVISIDSFIVHIASSLTKPVFAIYGPSGEEHWAPWRTARLCYSERDRFPCRPCGQDGCGGSKVSECLRAINQNRLLSSLDQFLDDIRQQK